MSPPWFNGLNIPWNDFGNDIGVNYDRAWFSDFFAQTNSTGGNAARFWLHANGQGGMNFADGDSGAVTGLTDTFISDLQDLVALAGESNVVLQLCLWSFDMCHSENVDHSDLITSSDLTQSYLDNALAPALASIKGSEHVVIEVINEPEWCVNESGCTTPSCVDRADMQRFVGAIATTAHHAGFPVTVGSAALKWNAEGGSAEGNYWSDSALQAAWPAGGAAASLDLYNVHYYDWMHDDSWGYDPCREDVSYWQLDKPAVIGELPASSDYYSAAEMIACAFDNGFAGDLFWAYNDPGFPIDAAQQPLADFAAAHSDMASYDALVSWLGGLRAAGEGSLPPLLRGGITRDSK